MSNVSKSVVDKIKKEDVKPKPKWWFVIMHAAMWMLMVLAVFVGSMAVGVLIHEFVGTDWTQVHRLGRGMLPGFVLVLPYLWFGILGLMLLVSYYLFAHTKKGYRFHPLLIMGAAVLISVLLGMGLYISRTSERFEQVMIERIPQYAEYQREREQMWVAPDRGVLAGIIVDEREGVLLVLNDVKGQEWRVDISGARYRDGQVAVGRTVMAVGEKVGAYEFTASEVRPFQPRVLRELRTSKKNERNVRERL